MKKEEIKNSELKRLITMKSNKLNFDEVNDEDLENIREISLNSYLINGKESEIDLNIIRAFLNLKDVRISNFTITQDIIDMLEEQEKIEGIEFVNTTFDENIKFSKFSERLKKISFTNCEKLAFDYPNVSSIQIMRSNVDFKNVDFNKIKKIFIQNSTIQNVFNLDEYENIEIVNLDGSRLYDKEGKQVQDISVAEKTSYTHKSIVYYYDSYLNREL